MSRDRDPGRGDDGGDDGPLGSLLELLELLAEMEERGERRRDGRMDVGGKSVDFSVGIGTLDDLADRRGRTPRGPGGRSPAERDSGGERDDDSSSDELDDGDVYVDVRRTESGPMVVADLPDVDEGQVDVTVDEDAGRLHVLVDGSSVGSVPLSGEELTVADATVRNRVLEVRLEEVDHDT